MPIIKKLYLKQISDAEKERQAAAEAYQKFLNECAVCIEKDDLESFKNTLSELIHILLNRQKKELPLIEKIVDALDKKITQHETDIDVYAFFESIYNIFQKQNIKKLLQEKITGELIPFQRSILGKIQALKPPAPMTKEQVDTLNKKDAEKHILLEKLTAPWNHIHKNRYNFSRAQLNIKATAFVPGNKLIEISNVKDTQEKNIKNRTITLTFIIDNQRRLRRYELPQNTR